MLLEYYRVEFVVGVIVLILGVTKDLSLVLDMMKGSESNGHMSIA